MASLDDRRRAHPSGGNSDAGVIDFEMVHHPRGHPFPHRHRFYNQAGQCQSWITPLALIFFA
jgi:hypothetical protein